MHSLTLMVNIAFWSCYLVTGCTASSLGFFLLYRPRDLTNDCVISQNLRFDLSFGMGMSDTITLVLRTRADLDYQCSIDIVTDEDMYVLVVVRFPNDMATSCKLNGNALAVYDSQETCESVCDIFDDNIIGSPYFIMTVRSQVKLHFLSNSSVNAELNATVYQITATSARKMPKEGCRNDNESLCTTINDSFCFTSFVMCDGIKNCGVQDWYDEQKANCTLPVRKFGYAPVIAVVSAGICALMIAIHLMARILPPLANSFFVFNTNEDNRLRIDPILVPASEGPAEEIVIKKTSLIPVSISSSSSTMGYINNNTTEKLGNISGNNNRPSHDGPENKTESSAARKTAVKTVATKIQDKLRSLSLK